MLFNTLLFISKTFTKQQFTFFYNVTFTQIEKLFYYLILNGLNDQKFSKLKVNWEYKKDTKDSDIYRHLSWIYISYVLYEAHCEISLALQG